MVQPEPFTNLDNAIHIVFGGDVNFDPTIRQMWNLGLYRFRSKNRRRTFVEKVRRKIWNKFIQPLLSPEYSSTAVDSAFDELSIEKPNREHLVPDYFAQGTRPAEVDWTTVATDWDFPFRKISSFLRSKDLVVVNLETPLTSHARHNGLFKSDPQYAAAMKRAGISAVDLSNNHIFDAGEEGFYDTIAHLKQAGIDCIGIGDNLDHARAGKISEVKGTRFCFLAYTQFCNSRYASIAGGYPGIVPLDRKLMVEDIRRAADNADLVIVSLHWGLENQPNVHAAQVELAHLLVEAGADCLIGHHPHVTHAVEVYRNCPIFYSLGNFIFAQKNHPSWTDNFVCELIVSEKELAGVLIHPVSGEGGSIFQPELLDPENAAACLEKLQIQSIPFGTKMAIWNGSGYVSLARKEGTGSDAQPAFDRVLGQGMQVGVSPAKGQWSRRDER